MSGMIFYKGKADELQIVTWLQELQRHAHAGTPDGGNAAVLRVYYNKETYYVGGAQVNHGPLGTGAETSAVAALTTMFGAGAVVTHAWVISPHPEQVTTADSAQKLRPFASGETRVQMVHLNGTIDSWGHTINGLLPYPVLADDVAQTDHAMTPQLENAMREGHFMTSGIHAWLTTLQPQMDPTHTREAVVLKLKGGILVAGKSIQNPDATSSTLAMQSAVAIAYAACSNPVVEKVGILTLKPGLKEGNVSPPDLASLEVLADVAADRNIEILSFRQQGRYWVTRTLAQLAPELQIGPRSS